MKKLKNKTTCPLSLLLCICLALAGTACEKKTYDTYVLGPNEYLMDEDPNYSPDTNAVQLTAEDISQMNDGDAQMVFNADGYLTFLNGKYYEEKIEDHEDAVASINGVATLLGLSAGCEFFANYAERDDDGYTYYVFQQRYGDATVQFATLRVIVDPQGYAAGLSCSFTPNIGIAQKKDAITAEQAVNVVRDHFTSKGCNLVYYPDYTSKVALTLNNVVVNCYTVYTNNPDMTQSFDMPYYEHFVTYEGELIYLLPVASLATDNKDAYKASEYFDGLESMTYSGDVLLYDGNIRHIEVPIAYNPKDGLYYLADVERKIMVADYYPFAYENETLSFITSADGKLWDNMSLITYSNYITAYDFYKQRGITSVDGFGIPILVCVNYCDQNKTPVDNCCHFGINAGWACFAASNGYNHSEGLDIIGHEYTHGVTRYSMGGCCYINASGAISESYSDIMGNIMEMLTGYTSDVEWLIGEKAGFVWRSMSSPNDYQQPESVYDKYYMPPQSNPDSSNDNGGVHINNSLLNLVAYKLWKAGMPLADEASLWVTSIELLTPLSGYKDVHAALLMSVEINGYDASYKQLITDAFSVEGLLD